MRSKWPVMLAGVLLSAAVGLADGPPVRLPQAPPAPAPPPAAVVVPEAPPLDLSPRNDRALVTVVAGAEGEALHAVTGGAFYAYAEAVGADPVVLRWPGHPDWPMSCKFGIYRVLDHYDRIAYVDADVVFRPGCLDLFESCRPDEFGAADDMPFHLARQTPRLADYRRFRADMGFPPLAAVPWYLNAGVMVIPRSHRDVLAPPKEPIEPTHWTEQHHTNARLLESGLPHRLIDVRHNWQNWVDPGFAAAPPDAVLHFSGGGAMRRNRPAEMRKFL